MESFSQRFVLPKQPVLHVLYYTIVEAMFALDGNSYITKLNHSHPQSRSLSLRSSGRNVRLRDNPLPEAPGILAKTKLRIPYQRPIRFLPETDYPRASRSFQRIAGSGNEISGGATGGLGGLKFPQK